MRGQYSTHCGRRPRPEQADRDEPPGRQFLCVRCQAQVLICSCCDRGQIYCAGDCAREARRHRQRAAGRRYQASRRGRLTHAERARRYRRDHAQQKNVTHQGSGPRPPDDLLSVGPAAAASTPPSSSACDGGAREQVRRHDPGAWHCHWCGRGCPRLVRQDFLRHRARSVANHRR